jgi:hypothetical protein
MGAILVPRLAEPPDALADTRRDHLIGCGSESSSIFRRILSNDCSRFPAQVGSFVRLAGPFPWSPGAPHIAGPPPPRQAESVPRSIPAPSLLNAPHPAFHAATAPRQPLFSL